MVWNHAVAAAPAAGRLPEVYVAGYLLPPPLMSQASLIRSIICSERLTVLSTQGWARAHGGMIRSPCSNFARQAACAKRASVVSARQGLLPQGSAAGCSHYIVLLGQFLAEELTCFRGGLGGTSSAGGKKGVIPALQARRLAASKAPSEQRLVQQSQPLLVIHFDKASSYIETKKPARASSQSC